MRRAGGFTVLAGAAVVLLTVAGPVQSQPAMIPTEGLTFAEADRLLGGDFEPGSDRGAYLTGTEGDAKVEVRLRDCVPAGRCRSLELTSHYPGFKPGPGLENTFNGYARWSRLWISNGVARHSMMINLGDGVSYRAVETQLDHWRQELQALGLQRNPPPMPVAAPPRP